MLRKYSMEDAEMLADVKAYDAAKVRLEMGEDELIPLGITERRKPAEEQLCFLGPSLPSNRVKSPYR
jgi:hypothetical protein